VLVTPVHGAGREQLLKTLQQVHNVFNLRAGRGPDPAKDRIGKYFEKASERVP
jgi:hypothetical protein